jgi:DNA-binding response OmpR family regulator
MASEKGRDVLGTAALMVGDPALESELRTEFLRAGFDACCARDEDTLIEACHRSQATVAIVDSQKVGARFTGLCRRLSYGLDVAVMALVPQGDTVLRLRALTAGSDDCIDASMPSVEVVARARAILRRRALNGSRTWLVWGPISLNLLRYQAFVDGIPVKLTPAEFRILRALVENRGRVVSREHLLTKIHAEGEREAGGRTVDTHVYSLRKKLGPHGDGIRTVRGGGYSLDLPATPEIHLPYGLATQLVYRLAAPLVVLDSDMRVVFANEAAASLLGIEVDRVVGPVACRELLNCTVDGKAPISEGDCFGMRALALASSNPSVRYFVRSNGRPIEVEATYTYLEPSEAAKYVAVLLRPSKMR